MNRTLTVRRLSSDDWPVWRAVRVRALTEAPHAFSATLAEWQGAGDVEERWRARLDNVALNLVAALDDDLAGQASGAAPGEDGLVELLSMWVAPEARGRGVGDALVAEVIEWARTRSAAGVVLAVKRGNAPAITLYERAGFSPIAPTHETAPDEARMVRWFTEPR